MPPPERMLAFAVAAEHRRSFPGISELELGWLNQRTLAVVAGAPQRSAAMEARYWLR